MGGFSSFVEVLRAHAANRGGRRAFTFLENGETPADTLTYAELDRDACAVAALLQERVRPGDRALLMYPPGLDFVRAFMGCLYAGVVAVPVHPPRRNRSIERLTAVATDAQPAVALTGRAIARHLAQAQLSTLNVPVLVADRGAAGDAAAWVPPPLAPGTLAFLQYTSGSTGTPKGVMVTHGNLLHNNEAIKVGFDHSDASVFVTWLPVFHDMGLIGKVLQPIYVGAPSVMMEPASFLQKPVRWLRAITQYRGTTSGAPNSAYDLCVRKVADDDLASLDLSTWRIAFNGSEPVRASTVRRFHERFAPCGLRLEHVHPCYGLAEATLLVSIGAADTTPVFHEDTDGRTLVSSGQLWLDERLVVVDPETCVPCGPGERGELWLASPSVAAGYWNRPEETALTFHARTSAGDGPFLRTGDLGVVHDGQVFVTGRLKDLIIVRGRNVYPQDVEHTADLACPALARDASAAFSIELDADGGEQLAIVCEVARERLASLDGAGAIASIRTAIAEEHDVDPSAVVLVRPLTIPKTTSGKIQRRLTRERFIAGTLAVVAEWRRPAARASEAAATSRPAASVDGIRAWLVARLASHAGIPAAEVDPREPFSRYGLDSQAAVVLSGELQEWLGVPLAPTLAYDYPTIDALARHLGGAADGHTEPRLARVDAEPIAIVGVACRFPGADTPQEFWRLLREGRDLIGEPPEGRPNRHGLGVGGFIDGVELFDAAAFGISRREAEIMDPQQRLLLELAREALGDAGGDTERLAGSLAGVFVGISSRDYARLQDGRAAATDPYTATGNALSIAANRVSYHFDLRGPSVAIDTACSSSLVAIHQACESLRRGECAMALAGGVNLILSGELTTVFERAGMMSPSHRCRAFDAAADGYVRGEGAAVVVLKRLSEARRDGDSVWALIRGSAVNQDGRSNGLTAPNGPAQEAVVRAALESAGVAAAEISYVEAHGTGTPLGDPIEMQALMRTLGRDRSPDRRCFVGSVKTNIGHLEAAAGIAGLLKVVLALRHGEIPPHLHFTRANPHIAFEDTPFSVPTSVASWPSEGRRLAGVSSFGFGGTNAHVVVEEAPVGDGAAVRASRPRRQFTRDRYWIDDAPETGPAVSAHGHALLGRRLPEIAHAPGTHAWEATLTLEALSFLAGHRVGGSVVLPCAAFVEMALAAARELDADGASALADVTLHGPVALRAGESTRMQTVVDATSAGAWRVSLYNRVASSWVVAATATVIRGAGQP